MILPRDFLAQMALNHELSPEQTDVFLRRYGEGKSYKEIAAELETSPDACLKRMGQVYNKFNVSGSSRGKENRLRSFLVNQFQQQTAQPPSAIARSAVPEAIAPASSQETEPATDTEAAIASSTSETRIYQNLPHQDCTAFIGRQEELNRLLELLSVDHSAHLISVDGIGGVGKTTLVLEAAYRCLQASTHPTDATVPTFDAIIFTSAKQEYLTAAGLLPRLKREQNLRDIFRAIAKTLDRSEITYMPADQQLELIRDSLKHQRSLLIVDNLETIEDQQDVLSFVYDLPPTVKVVLTTREQALFVPIRLNALPEADGLRLIDHEAQEKGINLSFDQKKALYHVTSGIPAAIVYTIGQLASGYLLEDVLAGVTNATGDVARFCFQSSVQPLIGKPVHHLLLTLALFPKPVERDAIAQIALEVPDPRTTARGLAQLQQLSLVRLSQGRYSLLPLTREYALAELAMMPEFERAVRERWVNWYRRFSRDYGATDWKEWHSEYTHLDWEWENLIAVWEWCAAKERYEDVLGLWETIKGYAHVRGYWDIRLDWTDWLIQAAEQRGDWSVAAMVMYDRGWTLTSTGQLPCLAEASKLLQQAWELREYQTLTFQLELATSLVVLCIRTKQFDEARDWLETELSLLESADLSEREFQQQQVHIFYYQAEICYRRGDYVQAQRLYQQALELAKAVGWKRAEIAIQNWLADVAIELGNFELAQQLLERGLPVAERNKDKRSIAFHKRSWAILLKLQGNLEQAQRWASEAAEGFESLKMIPEAKEMHGLLESVEDDLKTGESGSETSKI